jgi:hypothetical protein
MGFMDFMDLMDLMNECNRRALNWRPSAPQGTGYT